MTKDSRLGIVVSHPIQYYAPLFRHLASQLDLVVFYCHNPNENEIGKDGFGLNFKWDIDLTSGYKFVFLKNVAKEPSLSKFNGCNTPDIGTFLKKENITHVLIFGWYLKSHWQAYFYCLKNKIPVAVRGDSQLNPNENKLKSIIKKLFYPFFIRRYDALLYVGERNKEYLLAHGAKRDQLIFSPHAVDQKFWSKINLKTHQTTGNIKLLWVAKFIEKKRPLDVVNAFKKAESVNSNMELYMVGDGPLLSEIKKNNTSNSVHFLGFKNQLELREIYQQLDCLILASDRLETWGLVVNEAFANELPAITSVDCGCAPDLIIENQSGYTFSTGNTDELSEKMLFVAQQLKNDPEYFKKGISEKNEIYSYSNACKGIIQFVKRV